MSGQKLIKNAKNGPFWRVFENLKLEVKQCYQIGNNRTKIGRNVIIQKIQMRHFGWYSNNMNWAFFADFCPINIDLSGNTVWAQVLGYQKDTFRSQCWMRLFLQFPNTVYAAQFYWIWQIRQEIVCTLFTEEIKGQTHFAIIIILSKN